MLRWKKNKKEKQKALQKLTVEKFQIIIEVLKQTFRMYKKNYFESDNYRNQKIL